MKTAARVHYVQQGPATGPAVVMLHGYSDSSFSFSRILPLLPGGLRVIVPDQRGHGQSARTDGDYSLDAMALDVVALMDALDVPTATILGHSMGSFVARRLAVLAPERITGLILVGAGDVFMNPTVRELQDAVAALTDPVDPAFVRDFQYSTVQLPVPEDFMNRAIAVSLTLDAATWKAVFEGMNGYVPAEAHIRTRTLILGGDKDAIYGEPAQRALGQAIQGARVELLADAGHTPHWEVPELVVEHVLRFVDA